MAEQRDGNRRESRPEEELHIGDLASCISPTLTPGGAGATLNSPDQRPDQRPEPRPDHLPDQSFHVVAASSSGEVQFRLPSRQAERVTREVLEVEGPESSVLMRGKRRALEQPQVPCTAEQAYLQGARTSEVYGARPHNTTPRAPVTTPHYRYSDLMGREDRSNHGEDRSHGLSGGDYRIMGEPIRGREGVREGVREQGIDWRRDPRGLCPSFQSATSQCDVRERDMHIERGPQVYPRLDQPRPSHPGVDYVSRYDARRPQPTQQVVGGSDRRESRKYRKPATFDGSSNWTDYLVHFEIVADLNRWNNEEKALELATCLRGVAQGVLSDLRPENRRDFTCLVSALSNRFQPDNQAELYRAQMKNRFRKRGEPLSELSHEVKRLVRLAYPSAPQEVKEHLARDCFIDSLNNSELEWAVFQGKPATVDQAMRLALEFEAFQAGRKRRMDGKADIRLQREEIEERPAEHELQEVIQRVAKLETAVHRPILGQQRPFPEQQRRAETREKHCYYCAEVGHFIARCPKRMNDQRQERQQYVGTPTSQFSQTTGNQNPSGNRV